MNPIVYLKNVNISQNNTSILRNINLSVKKGEFIYFIGKTGVGKSSLLRVLYRDIKIEDGEAQILDFNLNKIKDKEIPFLRRKLGVVFQDFKLLPNKTIKQNLEFVLRATEWVDSEKINSRIKEVLQKVKEVRKVKNEQAKKIAKAKSEYIFKINDRVRLVDGNAVGTIEKIEKNKAFINYGIFTTEASFDKLEFVEKSKK